MREFMQEKIEKNTLTGVLRLAIGVCPKCGSGNTHSCEKSEYVSAIGDENDSDCLVALELDNITIGHCDVCSHIWCLECGKKISLRDLSCSCY